MRIAIISDVHNNLANLKKVLEYCKNNGIEKIICCGDLASMETLDFLNDNYSGEIYYCFGNMDNEQLKLQENIKTYKLTNLFKDYGETSIEGKNIAFTHYPQVAERLCQAGKYNYVFYGHIHKPWMEKINNCLKLNPGNVAGEIYQPTFAVWETVSNKFELVKVHDLG